MPATPISNTNLNGEHYYYTDPETGVTTEYDLERMISCNQIVTTDGKIIDIEPGQEGWVPTAEYQVWARALGTPGGSANVTTCATVQDELQCSLENAVLTRKTGKSRFTDVTDALTSLVVDYCWVYGATGECMETYTTRIALFAGDTEDWFWNYDNKGLRLAQLRFYNLD